MVKKPKTDFTTSRFFYYFCSMRSFRNKGRSKQLIGNRNKKLAARFYFYSHLCSLHYEKCLELLEEELDISQSTINDLLYKYSYLVDQLVSDKVTLHELKTAFPFFNWRYDHGTRSQNAKQTCLALFG